MGYQLLNYIILRNIRKYERISFIQKLQLITYIVECGNNG